MADMNDDYIEIIPVLPPEEYTMRAETIRNWLKGIAFILIVLFVGFVLAWGLP